MKRRNWTTLLIHSSMLLEGWCEWQDNGPIFWRWPIHKLIFYMVALSMVIPTQYDTAICRSHGQKMKQPHLGPCVIWPLRAPKFHLNAILKIPHACSHSTMLDFEHLKMPKFLDSQNSCSRNKEFHNFHIVRSPVLSINSQWVYWRTSEKLKGVSVIVNSGAHMYICKNMLKYKCLPKIFYSFFPLNVMRSRFKSQVSNIVPVKPKSLYIFPYISVLQWYIHLF